MLRQPVGRRHIREVLRRSERRPVVGEDPRRRVRRYLGVQHVRHRGFEGLVVLGERALHHLLAREQAPGALIVHDERPDAVGGTCRRPIVGHVDADPPAAVPFDYRLLRVPRLAGNIAAGAIVEDPPVGRPRPRPVGRNALLARVGRIASRHLIALLGVAARENPAARLRGAVIAQLRKAVEQLTGARARPRRMRRRDRPGRGRSSPSPALPGWGRPGWCSPR